MQGLRWGSGGSQAQEPLFTVPTPMVLSRLTRLLVTLRLENVAATTVDLGRAGLRCGRVRVTSDHAARVTLVLADGSVRRVDVPEGARTIPVGC